MKNLKSYKEQSKFCKESIRHLLKPKSKDKIIKDVLNSKEISLKNKLLNGCKYGLLEVVKDAVEKGADITMNNNWPIRLAMDYNNTEVVKYLLSFNKVDPSEIDNSVFMAACKNNNKEIIEILLKDNRVDPTDNIIWVIKYLIILKNYGITRILLKDYRIKNSLSSKQYDFYIELLKKKPHNFNKINKDDI